MGVGLDMSWENKKNKDHIESIEQSKHALIDSVISVRCFNPVYVGKICKNMTKIPI